MYVRKLKPNESLRLQTSDGTIELKIVLETRNSVKVYLALPDKVRLERKEKE